MAPDVIRSANAGGTLLDLTFADGSVRRVDIARLAQPHGVFERLNEPGWVASARVNPDTGTIEWECGADLSPERLYEAGILVKSGQSSAA